MIDYGEGPESEAEMEQQRTYMGGPLHGQRTELAGHLVIVPSARSNAIYRIEPDGTLGFVEMLTFMREAVS